MRQRVGSGSPLEPQTGFSRAIRVDRHVFVAATAAIWPEGHVDDDAGAQCRRCLEIIVRALSEAGAALADGARTRALLTDAADADAVAAAHAEVFGDIRPATAFILVSGFLDPRWRVEIEADAIIAG